MLSQNQAKLVTALHLKKYRQKYQKFLVEGEKMVAELLQQKRFTVANIFCMERWTTENRELYEQFYNIVNIISEQELKKISTLSTPNLVLAVVEIPEPMPDFSVPADRFCLYLDGLQDPGNLGAILRIADWFGLPAVFCAPDTVDLYNPKVVQASMGSVFRVRCQTAEVDEILDQNPNLPLVGAVMDGENVFEAKLPQNGLLVIGNEGNGVSATLLEKLNLRVSIPRHPEGGAESLNAAVATGILVSIFR